MKGENRYADLCPLFKMFINMTVILLLIGISLGIAVAFLAFFIWSVKTGQYDDTYTPSIRILFEDRKKSESE